MPRITRRGLMAGGAVAVIVPATLVVGTLATPHEEVVIAYLRHKLPGLAVSQVELEDHVRRFISAIPVEHQRLHYGAILAVMANPALEATMPGRLRGPYEEFTRKLITGFLLSTDFFGPAGAQPARTSYVAFRDPYELGCSNPLARPVGAA